ncbi:MAG: T9SS type A sorting domain-containing protein [Bacteroidota bacterium]
MQKNANQNQDLSKSAGIVACKFFVFFFLFGLFSVTAKTQCLGTFDHTTQTGHLAGPAVNWTSVISAQTGNTYTVTNDATMASALASLASGDVLLLANGTYSQNWTINASNVVITAVNPGTWNNRNVTKTNSKITINGSNVIIGGFLYTWPTNPLSNSIIINGASVTMCDMDIKNINYPGGTDRCIVQNATADNFSFRKNLVDNINGAIVLALDPLGTTSPCSPAATDAAQYVIYEYNSFLNIDFYCIQTGQYFGDRLYDVYSQIRFNKFDNCYTVGETKTSRNYFYNNWVYQCGKPLHNRQGTYNVYYENFFEETGTFRIYDLNNSVINNVFLNSTGYNTVNGRAIDIPEGSLASQICSSLSNATHIRCENLLIANNTFINPVYRSIYIGYQQTGGNGPNNPQPYSAKNVWIINNAFQQNAGMVIALRNPNTVPDPGDNYPTNIDTYQKYVGLTILNNQFDISGTAIKGDIATSGYIAWNDVTRSINYSISGNLNAALNFINTFRPPSNFSGLNMGIAYNYNNINSLTANDYDGNPRTSGAGVDIGAVEYQYPLVAGIASTINVLCYGGSTGSAAASATGGSSPYSYLWNNGQTTQTATGLSAGTYTVTITDANGCTSSQTANITEPSALASSISSSTNVLCNGGNTGSAAASATGGTSPYTYLWSNSQSTATATGLSAGTYTVTITDANGCTSSQTVMITQPTALSVSTTTTPSGCSDSTGTATATPSGGVTPYTYLWSNGQTLQTATSLPADIYTITITDANGCIVSQADTVSCATGIDEVNETSSFIVYPNPTDGSFTIILSDTFLSGEIVIFNSLGQQVVQTTIADKNQNTIVDIGTYPAGMYTIMLRSDSHRLIEKIVKK